MRQVPRAGTDISLPQNLRRWQQRKQRREARLRQAEGPALPVITLMVVVIAMASGGFWLVGAQGPQPGGELGSTMGHDQSSLTPEGHQVRRRLEALGIHRGWFRRLMTVAQAQTVGEQQGWLVRLQQLPASVQLRLGRLNSKDLHEVMPALAGGSMEAALFQEAVTRRVELLLKLSPEQMAGLQKEPWRQLWLATALQISTSFQPTSLALTMNGHGVTDSGYLPLADSTGVVVQLLPPELPLNTNEALLSILLEGNGPVALTTIRDGVVTPQAPATPAHFHLPVIAGETVGLLLTNLGMAGGSYSYTLQATGARS